MASDFTELVNDLAYAKTFYPSGKITSFINTEASKIYLDIYRNRKEESNRIVHFWKYELPLTIRKHHKVVLFSFVLFLIFGTIGYLAAMKDDSITRAVLGDAYIERTQENIAKGNPFGIFEGGNPFLSWIALMIHNIRVSFLMFVSGIFCGVPALYLEAQNAVMVGTFDQFFAARGLGLDFWLVVFVHGTIEITSIIVAGAAGLILGKSFLFPGTIRRVDAFKAGAKDGLKLMVGLIPLFALAAFFEGFITRLYNDVSVFTTFIMVASVIFVTWYFIIYPIKLGRRPSFQPMEEEI
jgi:uncharacterized membrane protein SpoIIM required for sporulation